MDVLKIVTRKERQKAGADRKEFLFFVSSSSDLLVSHDYLFWRRDKQSGGVGVSGCSCLGNVLQQLFLFSELDVCPCRSYLLASTR